MRKAFAVGAVLAVGGLGWAVAQEPPTIKLDVPVAIAPPPLSPPKLSRTLSREAAAELQRLREQSRKLSAAVAAFEAEKPKWEARRRVQQVALDAEHAAVTAAERPGMPADPKSRIGLPRLDPGPVALPQVPLDPAALQRADEAKIRLAATVAARDRQARLRDQILQRLTFLDQSAAECGKRKELIRDRSARIYYDELDEDGPGYDKTPAPLPEIPALPAGPQWDDHSKPWPPAGDKRP